jgi:hypothetical protein
MARLASYASLQAEVHVQAQLTVRQLRILGAQLLLLRRHHRCQLLHARLARTALQQLLQR